MHQHQTHTTTRPPGAQSASFWMGMRGAGLVFLTLAAAAMTAMATISPAHAAETSASAAAALKVLSMPLSETRNPDSPAATAPSSKAQPGHSITVQKGEGIDAVIRRGLPGLPLKEDFMRLALAKANPKIFPRGQTYPVRPGTVLQLPSHEALRQLIVSRHPEAADLFQAPPIASAATEDAPGTDKRRWVRFP
ncbi:MAG: hypothetical protein AAB176_00985 [Pseudomonadota bacterium]